MSPALSAYLSAHPWPPTRADADPGTVPLEEARHLGRGATSLDMPQHPLTLSQLRLLDSVECEEAAPQAPGGNQTRAVHVHVQLPGTQYKAP